MMERVPDGPSGIEGACVAANGWARKAEGNTLTGLRKPERDGAVVQPADA
jgi:hypothetical protein